jgi:SAM-dependent methyltransferase
MVRRRGEWPSLRKILAYGFRVIYRNVARFAPFRAAITRVNLFKNRGKQHRQLEIGPGTTRIQGFETLNIVPDVNVDYVWDATRRLPFTDNTFSIVYTSHILEHVPWYQLNETVSEWVRILKPGGRLEIWVPNGLEIARVFVDYETTGVDRTNLDGWYRFNEERDPCLWAAGRIYTYGDGKGTINHPNWHRALFSPRFLQKLLIRSGLQDVQQLDRSAVRGHDHGWINLGFSGIKP